MSRKRIEEVQRRTDSNVNTISAVKYSRCTERRGFGFEQILISALRDADDVCFRSLRRVESRRGTNL